MLDVSFSLVAGFSATFLSFLLMFLIDDMVNAWSTERTNEQSAINAKQQRDWQEKMWNLNNAYNDPSRQKARLENAGINPYSVMAGDGADTGNSSSPPQSVPPAPVTPFAMSNGIGMDLLQAMKLASEKEGQDIKNDTDRTNLAFLETQRLLEISETRARIRKLLSSKDVDESYKDYLRTQDAVLQGQATSILKKSRAEANQAETITQNLQRQYDDQHNESVALQALQDANAKVSKAQVKQIGATIGKIYQEIRNLQEDRKLTKQEIKKVIAEKLNIEENTKVLRGRNTREGQQLRANLAKQLYDMLITAESNQLGILGTWRGGDSEDVDYIGNDMVDFIMNGSLPRRSNNVQRSYDRNHPSSRFGVR